MRSTVAFALRGQGTDALELDLYEAIGGDPLFGGGITAQSVLTALGESPKAKKILVRINSAGGIVTEGLAIYNLLKNSSAEVTCRVDGMAGSIASVIAMVGRLEMPPASYLMIHNPWAWTEGEAGDLRHQADVLDSMREQMLSIYCEKSGKSRDLIGSLMDEEKWMTGTEALAYGLCDSLVPTPKVRLAAQFDLSRFKNTPRSIDTEPRAELAPITDELANITTPPAAEKPTEQAADNTAASGDSPMDEQVYKDKIAELETVVAALKAELDGAKNAQAKAEADLAEARAKFPKKGDDDEDEDDDEKASIKSVVAKVKELTGHAETAGLLGALMAHEAKKATKAAKSTVAERVTALITSGKMMPSKKAEALKMSVADLDAYEKLIGAAKVGPVGEEHVANDNDPQVVAARESAQTPQASAEVFDPSKVTLTAQEIAFCRGRDPMGTEKFAESYLATKRADAQLAHDKKHRRAIA